MLEHLFIQNFILIDQLELDFKLGFSAITGETGAGKSIFLDALSLVQGNTASSSMVQKGKEKAIIEATFRLKPKPEITEFLKENGFEIEDQFTVTREIYANGKSNARFEHRVVPLKFLKTLVEDQLDIHGQKDSAYLLQKSRHRFLLEEYGNLQFLVKEVKSLFDQKELVMKEKSSFIENQWGNQEREYYEFQLEELKAANLKEGEEEELKELEKRAKEAQKSAQDYLSLFDYYDQESSSSLYQTIKLLDRLKGCEDSNLKIHDAYETLVDELEIVRDSLNPEMISEEELNEAQERLFLIQRLKRKFGPRLSDVLQYQKDLEEKFSQYDQFEEQLSRFDERIEHLQDLYLEKAKELTLKRKESARSLEKLVIQQLHDLELSNAKFSVHFESIPASNHGLEEMEFYVSMNKGEDLKPLVKVASGGELSRFMLALKVIFSKLQGIQTIVFDEIDTGVSGHVARAIGKKMALLAKDCQVFSVTHLAQVASLASIHYQVEKIDDAHKTITRVRCLTESERPEVIAYLFSGNQSEKAIEAAKELLEGTGNG